MVASLELDFPLLELPGDDDAGDAAAAGTALDRSSTSSANGSNGSLASEGDLGPSAGGTSAGLSRSLSSSGSSGDATAAVEAVAVADVRLLAADWAEQPGALSRVARVRVPPTAAAGDTIEVMRESRRLGPISVLAPTRQHLSLASIVFVLFIYFLKILGLCVFAVSAACCALCCGRARKRAHVRVRG
jgi:hypothetical protein